MKTLIQIIAASIIMTSCSPGHTESGLPRIVVLSDINNVGGDPDDKQSMAHLFMFADEVDIRAIVPDYWKGEGVEATMEAVDAYRQDFSNPSYTFASLGYPHPDTLQKKVMQNEQQAINTLIREAKKEDKRPLYVLVWGNMKTLQKALYKAPEITKKLRVLTIATNVMADNPDSRQNAEVDVYCKKINWNGPGRNEIFNDRRFDELWWIENDWAYNGMFKGHEPADFLLEIKEHGKLGYYIWEQVQSHSWAHYFRAGDTPTLLYLLEDINHDDPSQFTWGGVFTRAYPEQRPNYWIDDAGISGWNYKDPCKSWDIADRVYEYRVEQMVKSRAAMYEDYRNKMQTLYKEK